MKNFTTGRKFGSLEVIEIIQLGTMLFLFSILGAFIISLIFTEIDKKIDNVQNEDTHTFLKIFETYIQLIVTAIVYFYIEKLIYYFPSVSTRLNKKYVSFTSANYVIHIILIIVLIDMNSSLMNGVHFVSNKLNINGTHV